MLLKIKKGFYGKHTSLAEIDETVKQAPQVVNILSSTEWKKKKGFQPLNHHKSQKFVRGTFSFLTNKQYKEEDEKQMWGFTP